MSWRQSNYKCAHLFPYCTLNGRNLQVGAWIGFRFYDIPATFIYRFTLQADPTADLSFNLRLTDSEKQARSQVRLPYTLDNEQKAVQLDPSSGSGQIIYHPDDADDFDEEDPDEDLDI